MMYNVKMARKRIIALVDCDSFFVSCEQVLNPELKHKAVCVLSNNDGCIVSRSYRAKKIGVKMGMPYFMAKRQFPSVAYVSGNLEIYAKFSREVMNCLKNFSPDVEIYSIDEAFLDLTGTKNLYKKDYIEIVEMIKKEVKKQTGIDVSIGLSTSKTLAKLASDKAKNKGGIYAIGKNLKTELEKTKIEEIWGIGKNTTNLLKRHYIEYASQFVDKDDNWIKEKMGKTGLDMKQELLGVCISAVDAAIKKPKSIQKTASFKEMTKDKDTIKTALNSHIHRACKKLRKYEGSAFLIGLYLRTKEFQTVFAKKILKYPTNFELEVSDNIMKLFEENYCPYVIYRSSGVVLGQITYEIGRQMSLFEDNKLRKNLLLSKAIDNIEEKYGRNTIRTGF